MCGTHREEPEQRRRELLYVMNPQKMAVCEMLARYHSAKGDKILLNPNNAALRVVVDIGGAGQHTQCSTRQ